MRASSLQPFGQPQALAGEAPSSEASSPAPIPLLPPPSARQMDMDAMQSSGPTSSMVQQLSGSGQVSGQLSAMPQQLPDTNRRSGQLNPMPQQLPDNMQVPGHLSFMPQELPDNMRSSRPSSQRPEGERPLVTSQASRSASVTSEQRRGTDYVELGVRLESFRDRAWRVVDIRQLSCAGFFAGDLIFARPWRPVFVWFYVCFPPFVCHYTDRPRKTDRERDGFPSPPLHPHPATHPFTGAREVDQRILTKSKHTKGSKERYLLRQKHNLQIFGGIPLCQATKWHFCFSLAYLPFLFSFLSRLFDICFSLAYFTSVFDSFILHLFLSRLFYICFSLAYFTVLLAYFYICFCLACFTSVLVWLILHLFS